MLAWAEYRLLRGEGDGDPVVSPLPPPPGVSARPHRWTTLVPALLIPVAYVALAGLTFLLE